MSELDEFLAGIRNGLRDTLGEEGLEQLALDEKWIQENFSNQILANLRASSSLIDHGACGMYIINSAFYSGIHAYRTYLVSLGVDILALEGRVE